MPRFVVVAIWLTSLLPISSHVLAQETEMIGTAGKWVVEGDGKSCTIRSSQDGNKSFSIRIFEGDYYSIDVTGNEIELDYDKPERNLIRIGETERNFVNLHYFPWYFRGEDYFEVVDGNGGVERFDTDGLMSLRNNYIRCQNWADGLKARGPEAILVSVGDKQDLARAASRAGLLQQRLGFALKVSTNGEVVDCYLARRFKRKSVTSEICSELSTMHKFRPAIDKDGNPTDSVYDGEISVVSFLKGS